VVNRGKEIPWMRLKRQHATGHRTLCRLTTQQRKHGLVTTVHAVEVADGQCASRCHTGVMKTTKNLHEPSIFLIASGACPLYV
jgi:hypothetical protein